MWKSTSRSGRSIRRLSFGRWRRRACSRTFVRSARRSWPATKILRAAVVAFLMVACFARPALSSEFCDQFGAFVNTKLTDRSTRWIEMRWFGTPGVQALGTECHHSEDTTSSAFCDWLVPHTSFEWPERLPQSILTCRGYRFPRFARWEDWKSAIQLKQEAGNAALLQIDLAEGRRSVRLTVSP